MAGKGTKNNQQNTQGDAQTEQAVQTKPLDFDVRIHSIKPNESIKGTASVNINGAFAIRGVKIIEGSNGLFVSMPSYKVGNEYKDICFPITQECRKQLHEAVIGAYEQAISQGQDTVAKHHGMQAPEGQRSVGELTVTWIARPVEPARAGSSQTGEPTLFMVGLYDMDVRVMREGRELHAFQVRQVGWKQLYTPES